MSPAADTGPGADARHRALLDERSAALAGRGRSRAGVATRPVLLCLCGPDRYGLPLGEVAQVMPARACTPVPGAPDAVLGLVVLSGRVVSVIGLAEAMGRPRREPNRSAPSLGHFVVLRGGSAAIALAVDRVEGIVPIPVAAPSSDPGSPPEPDDGRRLGSEAVSVYAAAGPQNGAIVLIDPRRLLRRYLP